MILEDLKYYDGKSIILEDFELEGFQRVELLIFLINHLNIKGKIEDYYLILGGRGLISRHSFNSSDYLIQNARILLKTINQKKVYIDELEKYEDNEGNTNKLYVKQGDRFVKVAGVSREVEEREELYLKLLSLELKYAPKPLKFAFQDEKRYGIIVNEKPIEISLLKTVQPEKLPKAKKKKSGIMKLTVKELIEEAGKVDEILSGAGKGYRKKILENNTIKIANKDKLYEIKEIEISKVTNIIGQVGAGKSTFIDVAVKRLVNEKRKIVIIEPSVNKALRKSEDLNKLGIKAVPIVGESAWKAHINKQNDGKDFLRPYDSKILTAGCPIGGLLENVGYTIEYGKEPCTDIYRFYEREESKKNQLNKKEKFKCPYYYICPKTRREAEIITSDVIITTTAGLSTMKIGISGVTLLEYVLDYVDLIIVDEAESELQKVDKVYAPYISYDDYIRNNGSIPAEYYKKLSDERISRSERDRKHFIRLHTDSDAAFTKIHNLLERDKQGFNKSKLKKAFSGQSLINYSTEKQKLPIKICEELNKMVGLKRNKRYKGILRDLFDVENEKDLLESFDAYEWGISEKLSNEQVNMIIFIGAVLYFEDQYRSISNLVEGNEDLPMSTKAILSQRFEFHQRHIPVSPKGNIFALQYRDKDNNGKSDLCVLKQFAMGRAMYLRFPWLKLDEKGEPKGPNVLLLSGSSFAPGSLSNHMNEPVNYIIEAESFKREFISKSHFEFLDMGIYVSGSGDERGKRLRELVREMKELILYKLRDTEDNILMIVNSYPDAVMVSNALTDILKDTEFKDKTIYLVPDSDNDEEFRKIKQSKVSQFANKGARILIAPAILIERGHNIVDDNGNAAFDTLIFVTRPMNRPYEYSSHVSKVNGYIMNKYSNRNYEINTKIFAKMRKDANILYNWLESKNYSIDNLRPLLKKDIVVTLFVMILQIFGRLCRIGNQEDMKAKAPEVYFADASFKVGKKKGFDFLNELVKYLDEIMNSNSIEGELAKSLYGPFYDALKKGRYIYGER